MKYIFIWLIKAYQIIISPLLPANTCRFYPTCSEYAIESYRIFGVIKGTGKTVWRLLRCHPFHPGGFDPALPEFGDDSVSDKNKQEVRKFSH